MPKSMKPQEVVSGPSYPSAGAGRGSVNPRPVNVSEEDYVSPADRMAMEERVREDRDMRAAEKAYNKSMSSMKSGGKVSSASKRADGIAERGKTRGTIVACGGGYMKGKK